jgi:hypothetical protein
MARQYTPTKSTKAVNANAELEAQIREMRTQADLLRMKAGDSRRAEASCLEKARKAFAAQEDNIGDTHLTEADTHRSYYEMYTQQASNLVMLAEKTDFTMRTGAASAVLNGMATSMIAILRQTTGPGGARTDLTKTLSEFDAALDGMTTRAARVGQATALSGAPPLSGFAGGSSASTRRDEMRQQMIDERDAARRIGDLTAIPKAPVPGATLQISSMSLDDMETAALERRLEQLKSI